MKPLLLALVVLTIALLNGGCAETRVSIGGKTVFRTQANCSYLEFHQGSTSLKMFGVDHAIATVAQGNAAAKVIGTTGSTLMTAAALLH